MYGLTEAFRATYLPPEEVDRRPDSIGKAIPNTEILVLRADGTRVRAERARRTGASRCAGRQGYWNDPEKTAERYKPLPGREAAWCCRRSRCSRATRCAGREGFLYFIGRRDEMIKTSGYRVSPTEVEEVLYATQRVGECAAFGVDHPALGQAMVVVVTPRDGEMLDEPSLLAECRTRMPLYMVPARIEIRAGPLPRNPNGKIDRKVLAEALRDSFAASR